MGQRYDSEKVRRAFRQVVSFNARGWGRTDCPMCPSLTGKPDRKQSIGFNINTGTFRCFKCGIKGRIPGYTGSADHDWQSGTAEATTDFGPPEGYEPLWREPAISSMVYRSAIDYLRRRCVSARTIREARIGASLSGRLAGRVIIPSINLDGSWYGWVARTWSNGARRKYLAADEMDTYNRLFNEAAIDIETDAPLILVEGVFDALPLWPRAAAFYGKPSDGQVERLRLAKRPLVVALDGDAWLEGEMLAMRLQLYGLRAGWLRLPPRTDPGNFRPDEFFLVSESAI